MILRWFGLIFGLLLLILTVSLKQLRQDNSTQLASLMMTTHDLQPPIIQFGVQRVELNGLVSARATRYQPLQNAIPAWSPDNRRVLISVTSDKTPTHTDLYLLDSRSFAWRYLTTLNGTIPAQAHWSPDGKAFAFLTRHANNTWSINLLRLDETVTSPVVRLLPDGANYYDARWQDAEHIRFIGLGQEYLLYTWFIGLDEFTAETPRLTGFLSPDGQQSVFVNWDATYQTLRLYYSDNRTRQLTALSPAHLTVFPRSVFWAPDNRQVAFIATDRRDQSSSFPQIYVVDVRTGQTTQLTDAPTAKDFLGRVSYWLAPDIWSPDSRWLVYTTEAGPRRWQVDAVSADGKIIRPNLYNDHTQFMQVAWSYPFGYSLHFQVLLWAGAACLVVGLLLEIWSEWRRA